jgi:hypothetical protein
MALIAQADQAIVHKRGPQGQNDKNMGDKNMDLAVKTAMPSIRTFSFCHPSFCHPFFPDKTIPPLTCCRIWQ